MDPPGAIEHRGEQAGPPIPEQLRQLSDGLLQDDVMGALRYMQAQPHLPRAELFKLVIPDGAGTDEVVASRRNAATEALAALLAGLHLRSGDDGAVEAFDPKAEQSRAEVRPQGTGRPSPLRRAGRSPQARCTRRGASAPRSGMAAVPADPMSDHPPANDQSRAGHSNAVRVVAGDGGAINRQQGVDGEFYEDGPQVIQDEDYQDTEIEAEAADAAGVDYRPYPRALSSDELTELDDIIRLEIAARARLECNKYTGDEAAVAVAHAADERLVAAGVAARTTLVEHHMRWAVRCARRYANRYGDTSEWVYEELLSRAFHGLSLSGRKYDPDRILKARSSSDNGNSGDRNTSFMACSKAYILAEMHNYLATRDGQTTPHYGTVARTMVKMIQTLAEQNSKPPAQVSNGDLARALGVGPEVIRKYRTVVASCYDVSRLDAPTSSDDSGSAMVDTLGELPDQIMHVVQHASVEGDVLGRALRDSLREVIKANLSGRQLQVLCLYYFGYDSVSGDDGVSKISCTAGSMRDVANALSIKESTAWTHLHAAYTKLKPVLEERGFLDYLRG